MSPTAGGYKVMIGDNLVTLVTPQSPLGKAILNKYLDDDISYHVGNKMICHTIITLI
jgi:transcription elongation GreA/GreB family factor